MTTPKNSRLSWPTTPVAWRSWLPTRGNALFSVLLLALLLWTNQAAAIPLGAPAASSTSTIPYQGRLVTSSGAPLTGSLPMVFRLYNLASGGAPLWTEQWTSANTVQVNDGLFNVLLGSLTAIPQNVITANSSLWLGITVGADGEMSPRVQLGSAAYAMQALTVPDGSINSLKLQDGSVGTIDLANQAVTTPKLSLVSGYLTNSPPDFVTTTSFQAVPGLSFTVNPTTPSYIFIMASVDVGTTTTSGTFIGRVSFSPGGQVCPPITVGVAGQLDRGSGAQICRVALTAGSHTVSLSARSETAAGATLYANNSQITYFMTAQ